MMAIQRAGGAAVSSPLTWQALQAIQSALAVVRIASGYFTDLGASVGLEFNQGIASDVPRVVVGMERMTVSDRATGTREIAFTAIIEVIVPASHADAQQRAHEALADVLRVFPASTKDLSLPDSANIAQVIGERGDVLPRVDGMSSIVAQARVSVLIREVIA